MLESLTHHRFIRERFGQVPPFVYEGDLLAAKWPGLDDEFGGIVFAHSQRQRRSTRGGRNVL